MYLLGVLATNRGRPGDALEWWRRAAEAGSDEARAAFADAG